MGYHLSVVEIIHEINQQYTPPSPKPRTPEMSITQETLQRYLYLIERGAGAILMLFGGYLLLGLWLG